jgi:hypothetical protein
MLLAGACADDGGSDADALPHIEEVVEDHASGPLDGLAGSGFAKEASVGDTFTNGWFVMFNRRDWG